MSFTRIAGYRGKTLSKSKIGTAAAGTKRDPDRDPEQNCDPARNGAIRSGQSAASSDKRFVEHVARADGHRDQGEWREAEEAYAAALALHPREAGYWVQHGHMCKEQGRFGDAEISYRSGAALGAEASDVVEHLRFVIERQGVSEERFPIRFAQAGNPAAQAPSLADIRLLAQLLWRTGLPSTEEVLSLLRESATCDDVFAAMVADARFEHANVNWLALIEDGDLHP